MTAPRPRSQQVIDQLRRASGSDAEPIYKDIEAVDYDWSVPHCFTARQRERLVELTRRAARNIARRLGEQLQGEIEITHGPLEQLYRDAFRQEQTGQSEYVLAFRRQGGHVCGVLVVARPQAIALVTRMLGSRADQEKSDRELSKLETDLLGYLLGSVTGAVSDALGDWAGPVLEPAGDVLVDERPIPEDVSELCRVEYTSGEQDGISFALVLDAEVFAEVSRDKTVDVSRTPEQVVADIRGHLERAPVRVVARVGTVQVPMRAIAELSEGDVLVMPGRAETPLTVEAEGKSVLEGRPSASQGKYALKIARRLEQT